MRLFREASRTYADASSQIIGIQSDIHALVRSVEDFRERELESISSVNLDDLSEALARELDVIFRSLQTPLDQAPSHKERKERIDQVLGQVDLAVMRVMASVGVPWAKSAAFMENANPLLEAILLKTGRNDPCSGDEFRV